MKLIKFNRKKHLPIIVSWLRAHNQVVMDTCETPKIGFMVMHKYPKEPIAAAFLRKIEGGYGQFDTLVTNPCASSQDRHEAIEMLTNQILRRAVELKMPHIRVITNDAGTLMRSQACGFAKLPHTLLIANLTSKENT